MRRPSAPSVRFPPQRCATESFNTFAQTADTSTVPGNTVQGLSGASYTAPAGYFALSPQQITKMDSCATSLAPNPGPNPTVLQLHEVNLRRVSTE